MNLKTISVTYERKFNLGDYNSAHIGMTLWADLEADEDEAEASTALWEMAKANVKAQALPLVMKKQAEVKDIFMGLPVAVQTAIDENGNPYEKKQSGKHYYGDSAVAALENDLAEIERKHSNGY